MPATTPRALIAAPCALTTATTTATIKRSSACTLLLTIIQMASAALLYEKGDWSSVWWLPKAATAPQIGAQVAIDGPLPHLIFVPPGEAPPTGWPLLVFLHGQGESQGASALANVALQGPPQHAGRHPHDMPFAVLSPQKPLGSEFFSDGVGDKILALIDSYLGSLPLDRQRVYLTGLSQGGIGTWGLASMDASTARRFAAIAPVCGGIVHGNKHKRATALADTPVWAFHGANDSILPVALSDDSIAALKATERTSYAGEPKYSRIEQARGSDYAWEAAGVPTMEGHASWVEAYYPAGTKVGSLPPLYEWMLQHRRANAIPGRIPPLDHSAL